MTSVHYQRKRILIVCVAMLCLFMTLLQLFPMFAPTAYAASCTKKVNGKTCTGTGPDHIAHSQVIDAIGCTYDQALANVRKKTGGIGETAFEWAATAYNANPHLSLTYVAKEIYMVTNLKGKFTIGGSPVGIVSAAKTLYNAMYPTGVMLIMLFFLIELLDEVQADSFTVEHLIKKLITLAVSILVLSQGPTILEYIVELGDAITSEIAGAAQGASWSAELVKIYQDLTADSDGIISSILAFVTAVGVIFKSIPGYLLSLVCYLVAYLISFSRFIELLVRFAFAPIGMAQLVSGGSKSAGMRYIKKFASVCLQGAVCVLTLAAIPIVQTFLNEASSILGMFIVPITAIGFLMKAGRVADDICGV